MPRAGGDAQFSLSAVAVFPKFLWKGRRAWGERPLFEGYLCDKAASRRRAARGGNEVGKSQFGGCAPGLSAAGG